MKLPEMAASSSTGGSGRRLGQMAAVLPLFLVIASILAGCALADLALWLGKWEDTGRSVDFQMRRFVLKDSFGGGKYTVAGTYEIDPNKYPKRVDFLAEQVSVVFDSDDGDELVFRSDADDSAIREVQTRVAVLAASPDDDAAVRLLALFLRSLVLQEATPGIYRINMYTGTYLEVELNMPDDARPADFGQGYVKREY